MNIGETKTLRTYYRHTVGASKIRKAEFKIRRVSEKQYEYAHSSSGKFSFTSGFDSDDNNYWDVMDEFKAWEKRMSSSNWFKTIPAAKNLPFPNPKKLKLVKFAKTKPQYNESLAVLPSNDGVRCFISKNWILDENNKYLAPCFSAITKSFQEIFRKFPNLLLEAELVSYSVKNPFKKINRTKETNLKLYEEVKKEFSVHLFDIVSQEDFKTRRERLEEIRRWSNSKIFRLATWEPLYFAKQCFDIHQSNLSIGAPRTIVKPIHEPWGENFFIHNKHTKVVDVVNVISRDGKMYKIIADFPGYGMVDVFIQSNKKTQEVKKCKIEYAGILGSGAPANVRLVKIY